MRSTRKDAARWALIFVTYCVSGHLGLGLDAVGGFATVVWAPAGIVLAALVCWGVRYWPAVFLSAAVLNFAHGSPVAASLGIGVGNTLEAVAGAFLLSRVGFRPALDRIRDVLVLMVSGAASTWIAPSIGVSSLLLGGALARTDGWEAFRAWWVGDFLGILLVAPLLFAVRERLFPGEKAATARSPGWKRGLEAVALITVLIAASVAVFIGYVPPPGWRGPIAYVIFPIVTVAALRFGQFGATASTALVACIAVIGGNRGTGPFASEVLLQSLFFSQSFVGTLATTGMLLAASLAERATAQREVQRALEAREEFMSVASHELKTPLTVMSLHSEIARREILEGTVCPELKTTLVRMIESNDRQVRRFTRLVNDMLDFSRMRAGQFSIERRAFDLSELLADSYERFAAQYRAAGVALTKRGEGSVWGCWDRDRIGQVIDNLLSNALKYGAGEPVDISWRTESGRAVVKVRDEGPGLASGDQHRLFAKFERGRFSRSAVEGLGLGLYLSREIVRAHGGALRVESGSGKGAIFILELPTSAEPSRNDALGLS